MRNIFVFVAALLVAGFGKLRGSTGFRNGVSVGVLLAIVVGACLGAAVGSDGVRVATLDPVGTTGRAIMYPYDEFQQTMESDGATYKADGSTLGEVQDGTTYVVDKTWIQDKTGRCIETDVVGTWAGATDAKSVRLTYMNGSTAVDLVSLTSVADTNRGDVVAKFKVCFRTSTAYVAWGNYTVTNGSTVVSKSDMATGTLTIPATTVTFKTRWSVSAATAVAMQYYATFTRCP